MHIFESFEEKTTFFDRTTIMDIDSLREALERVRETIGVLSVAGEESRKKYFFRGVENASFRLYSSMQRCCNNRRNDRAHITMAELSKEVFNRVRRSTAIMDAFRQEVQEDNLRSEIAMWAFIQHYGGPSHLVDFTLKVENALYFAISEKPENWVPVNDNEEDLNNYISLYIYPDNFTQNGNLNKLYDDAANNAARMLAEHRAQNPGERVDAHDVNEQMIVQALEPVFWGASVYGEELFTRVDLENGDILPIDYRNSHIIRQEGNFFLGGYN